MVWPVDVMELGYSTRILKNERTVNKETDQMTDTHIYKINVTGNRSQRTGRRKILTLSNSTVKLRM